MSNEDISYVYLSVDREPLFKINDITYLSEFDPPPLLETTVEVKMVGLKRRQTFSVEKRPLLKVVGDLIPTYNLRRLRTP